MKRTPIVIVLMAVFLAGCATSVARHKVHPTFIETPQIHAPKKVILLSPDITVSEISAGGVVEKVEEWSKQAHGNVTKALREQITSHKDLTLVELPNLNKDDEYRLEQHVALYDQVAGAAFIHTNGIQAWPHKNEHFDYTLGNGLQFLKEKTGADAAIFVIGEDFVSSAGRKAAFVIGAIFGVGITLGHSFLTAGVVDLETGNILWFDYTVSFQSLDLRKPEDAVTMVEDMFKNYPGLEPYQKQKVAKK